VKHALLSHATASNWRDRFIVEGYTSARISLPGYESHVLFHCNPCHFGKERYDFCLVNFTTDNDDEHEKTCPAKILSFVRFATPGFPTPALQHDNEVDKLSGDNRLYVIIHAANEYISWDDMESEFVFSFTLGKINNCVYIIDVDTISDPLFVFRNYGKDGLHHLCALPYRRWGKYFQKKI